MPKYQENIKIFFVTIDVQKGSLFGYICYSLRFVSCFLYLSYITYYGHYISFAFTKTNLCVIRRSNNQFHLVERRDENSLLIIKR